MEDYDNGKKEDIMRRAKSLSQEVEIELNMNSIKRIEPFLKELNVWYRGMARSPLMYVPTGYCNAA